MITDKQVEAAACSLNNCNEDVANDILGKRGFERLRVALEAAEKAAWRPINEIPDDEMLMVLAKNAGGMQMVWRAGMLHHQHHCKTPRHLDFGATEFRVIGNFDAPISGPLPKGPSDE